MAGGTWVVSGIPYLAQRKINIFCDGRTIIKYNPRTPLWSFLINMKTDFKIHMHMYVSTGQFMQNRWLLHILVQS